MWCVMHVIKPRQMTERQRFQSQSHRSGRRLRTPTTTMTTTSLPPSPDLVHAMTAETSPNHTLLLFSTFALPYAFAHVFFSRWMFRDVEVRWGMGFACQVVFCMTFATTFQSHITLILELFSVIPDAWRRASWIIDFSACLVLLKIVIPFMLFYALITSAFNNNPKRRSQALTAAIVVESLWLVGNYYGVLRPSSSSTSSSSSSFNGIDEIEDEEERDLSSTILASSFSYAYSYLETEIERVGYVGMTLIAILSGYGVVNGPFQYGPWLIRSFRTFDEAQMERVEKRLLLTLDTIYQQKCRERRAMRGKPLPTSTLAASKLRASSVAAAKRRNAFPPSDERGFNNNNGEYYPSSSDSTHQPSIAAVDYSPLAREIFLQLHEMSNIKRLNAFRRTWLGKLHTLAGYGFAVYCVLKIFSTLFSVFFPKKLDEPDFTTRFIYVVVGLTFYDDGDEIWWSQTLSFLLVGFLVFNSFRSLLMTLGRLFHRYGTFLNSGQVVALLLTEVLGHYMLSSLILLNLNLPSEHRARSLERFDSFRRVFDLTFLASALVSLCLILAMHRYVAFLVEAKGDGEKAWGVNGPADMDGGFHMV